MDKKEAPKNHILGPFTCLLESTQNTVIEQSLTLIQQSCISNTLIEQLSHIAYAITKKKLN